MDALSRAVLTFVLNSLWQVALVAAAATLGDLWLRRGPARYRHVLWVVCLAAAIVLPVSSLRPRIRESSAAVSTDVDSGLTSNAGAALTSTLHRTRTRSRDVWTRISLASGHRIFSLPRSLARAALALYLFFLAFMLVRFARAWLKTRQIRGQALVVDPLPRHVAEALDRCRSSLPGPRPLILSSTRVPGPVTVGVRQPAIILPLSLLDPASREELTAALAHELAHVCRRDFLFNLIYELLFLPLAFHPLALGIRRRLGDTRELACDEQAARVLNTSTYARSLVRLAHEISRRTDAALAPNYTLGVFDANILEERVMRLLKPRASGHLARLSFLSAAVLVSSISVAAVRFSFGINQPSVSSTAAQNHAQGPVKFQHPAYADTAPAVKGAVSGGVSNGVAEGVSGKVSGGVSGGARGGVSGGINGKVSETVSGSSAGQAPSQSQSQQKTGSLSGIVVDSSGTRIPKAEVRLTGRNNSFQKSMQSDETGNFSFEDVPAGRYSLLVSSPGMGGTFRSFEFRAEGEPPFFPFVLHPGSVSETPAVTAKSPHDLGDKAVKEGSRLIRVAGEVQAAKVIEGRQPDYPAAAKSRGAQGVVVLEATIATDGSIENLKVVSSPDNDLTKASLEAVGKWLYQPTLLNGDPVEVVTTVSVNFTLQD